MFDVRLNSCIVSLDELLYNQCIYFLDGKSILDVFPRHRKYV